MELSFEISFGLGHLSLVIFKHMNCQSKPLNQQALHAITRRHFFSKTAWGIGGMALASLLNEKLFAAAAESAVAGPLTPHAPHFAPKAKRVIYMFMEIGRAHV